MEGERRFYLDTSIWLDFFEKRGLNGELALKLIAKIIKEDLIIGYSDLNIKELRNLGYSQDEINEIFSMVKKSLRRIYVYKEDKEEAKKIASQKNISRGDALHAILARNNEFQLVSRDIHFEKLRDITIAKKPEEIY